MERYWRVLGGSVTARCEGGYPEQFINDATQRGFALWDIRCDGVILSYSCSAEDYVKLRPLARRACLRMRVQKKRGFPFWLKPLHHRGGLLLGALLFLVILQSLSSRVWVVEVVGNKQVSQEEILQTLATLGVEEGMVFSHIDIPRLQLETLQKMPQLTWLAVNQKGSTLTVEVRERQPSTPIQETAPSNIVSAHDGVIVKLHVESGQAAVKVGDAVTKDSLLISGVVDSNVGPLLKRAVGTIVARTQESITVTVPLTQTVTDPTPKIVEERSFYLLGFTVPLYTPTEHSGKYTLVTQNYPLRVYDRKLPVGFSKRCYVFEQAKTVRYSEEQALQLAKEQLRQKEQEQFANATLEKAVIKEHRTREGWQLTGTYTCVREIGSTQPINLQTKS